MHRLRRLAAALLLATLASSFCGCMGVRNYVRNGLKVGPNYKTPPAPVASNWIDANDERIRTNTDDLAGWWTVLNDPLLNQLMMQAYQQNLTLREAGFRVLASRAQLGIVRGQFFPQQQGAGGGYTRLGIGENFFSQWNYGFTMAWELDFWGRFRRAIRSAEASLDASVFNYNDVLVTLLGDMASAYVQARTTQERIRLLDTVIRVQTDVLDFIEARLAIGREGVTELDRAQAESNLKQTLAQRNQLVIALRQFQNQICILLGMPVVDLTEMMANGPQQGIPIAPEYLVVGIPADLLRRRPDVRRAEREAAAQAEQIGIAQADWLPAISISGNLGWQAAQFSDLFRSRAINSNFGPGFQWSLLNYGRILNNVRLQSAEFNRLVTAYQFVVLQADLEVENGIVNFLQARESAENFRLSIDQSWIALQVIVAQYEAGLAGVDFNRYALILQTLITQQDSWAQARGQINQGLIQVYRGLGGGWQIQFAPPPDKRGILSDPPVEGENVPAPQMPNGLPIPQVIAPDQFPQPPLAPEQLPMPTTDPIPPPAAPPINVPPAPSAQPPA